MSDIRKFMNIITESAALEADHKPKFDIRQNTAFVRWFKGSKVVSHDGQPLVVYHGTAAEFSSFSTDHVGTRHMDQGVGEAYYFTADSDAASDYANGFEGPPQVGANVVPVYLRMVNPHVVDFQGTGAEELGYEIETAKKTGKDGVIAYNIDDGGECDQYVVFSPKQIKSAYAVKFDSESDHFGESLNR